MKQLHKTLKEKREHEGYSQEYIAEKLKVSSSTISRWETGAVSMSIVIATKCNRLRVSGMRNDEVLGRLNRFKDNLIMSSCLNPKNRQL
ncbi:helix-turn-helix transcriptional regulator [Prevotella disiens]|uniref:helix-turn-helix transcriptional regulator n=1 Tax=Prevotella disiens TaxID=28130 RepID=UPI00336A0387